MRVEGDREFRTAPALPTDPGHDQRGGLRVRGSASWERPGHGLVPPDAFLDMAEENREIVAIGGWVLEEALEQLARWRSEGMSPAVVMSVNVSVQQLTRTGFPPNPCTGGALEGTDVLATSLVLEVTEHSLPRARPSPVALAPASGRVRVALDDFGTGYSSLTQPERLGVDIVKVDRDFVRSPTPDSPFRHEAFLGCGQHGPCALDVTIVVEGVETEAERQELLRAGFSLGQGFLPGTPTDHPSTSRSQAVSGRWPDRAHPELGSQVPMRH